LLEKEFKKTVINRLKKTPRIYFFVKEALAIRGIPDIIICHNGRFIGWELKRSKSEAGKNPLQTYNIEQIIDSGGYAAYVYPENFDTEYEKLLSLT
jgi:hypothetical protein